MAIFKYEKCDCGYKHTEPKPGKVNKTCPKCGAVMRYMENWYYSFQLDGTKYVECGGPQRRIAVDALAKKKVDIRTRRFYDEQENISWKDAVDAFKKTYPSLSKKTREGYDKTLKNLTPFFKLLTLQNINERHLREYKEQRLATGISGATFNRDRSTLKRIFSVCGVDWRFKKMVFDREKEARRDRFLQPEEATALEACLRHPHLMLAYLIATDTGLRKTATLSLNVDDIDWKEQAIRKIGKGGKEAWVPMTERLAGALQAYIEQHKIKYWIFPSPRDANKPMQDLKKSFKTAIQAAGIKGRVTWHDLRRSFASAFAEHVSDPKALQELLGHSDINITMNIYARTRKEHLRSRMKEFEEKTNRIRQPHPQQETKTTIDEGTKKQLIAMGWKPPEQNVEKIIH